MTAYAIVLTSTAMELLIDAFNVIYKFPELEEKMYRGEIEAAAKGLFQILTDFRKKWKKPMKLHIFVDGKKKKGDLTVSESIEGMKIYYSLDMSADHMIKEFIKSRLSTGELRVVTSDKDVREFAKKHKCQLQLSEEFMVWVTETMSAKKEKPEKSEDPNISQDEMAFWARMFRGKK